MGSTMTTMVETLDSDLTAFRKKKDYEFSKITARAVDKNTTLVQKLYVNECFDFDTGEGVAYKFDVRSIKDAMVAKRLGFAMFVGDVTHDLYQHVLQNNGIEEPRLAALKPDDLERPGLLAIFPDERSTIIDGNHRLVARYRLGIKTFRYAAFAIDDALKIKNLIRMTCNK